MPRLRRIIGVATAAMRDGWEQRVAAATGHGVSHDEGMLTIQTPMTRNEARHVALSGVDTRVASESPGCACAVQ
eukprot:1023577-Rhodomonas_salina.1